jgi:uncharacterized protein YciI
LRYLEERVAIVLAAGAKLTEDGEAGDGSFYLVDVPNAEEARRVHDGDPYVSAGLVTSCTFKRVRTGFSTGAGWLESAISERTPRT